ncbi:5-(carboxyamino)imidazole ribonucleotide mutase [Eubacteriales bacterium OttesenSCG-928-G02]|nr:5-(carboxyamino)imidazole ribonucleotide mutase [Eubacteriales bacterium OttesenSCG-928-G02]
MKKIAIIMGSISDAEKLREAVELFKNYNIPFDVHVYSAHRTPEALMEYIKNAKNNDFAAIIAAAGKAAHLAGSVAANTTLPVIGIPIKSSTLDGLDALLATVQMPSGVPVATVAIDGAYNAALLAIQILAVSDKAAEEILVEIKADMKKKVLDSDLEIKKVYNLQ